MTVRTGPLAWLVRSFEPRLPRGIARRGRRERWEPWPTIQRRAHREPRFPRAACLAVLAALQTRHDPHYRRLDRRAVGRAFGERAHRHGAADGLRQRRG